MEIEMDIEKKAKRYSIEIKNGRVDSIKKIKIIIDIQVIVVKIGRYKKEQFFAIYKKKDGLKSQTGSLSKVTEDITSNEERQKIRALLCLKNIANDIRIRDLGFDEFDLKFI